MRLSRRGILGVSLLPFLPKGEDSSKLRPMKEEVLKPVAYYYRGDGTWATMDEIYTKRDCKYDNGCSER